MRGLLEEPAGTPSGVGIGKPGALSRGIIATPIATPRPGRYTHKVADTLITDRRSSAPAVYKMIRRLGKGGMAEVFLARQEGVAGFRRLAVVKRLLPQFSSMDNVAKMLLDEARIAAQLNHPNIVQIYELNQEDNQYFIAMEFVDGCDLATLARIERRRKGRVPMRLSLRVIAEAAMGLDYAHRQVGLNGLPLNLVHRDVSPHNILCSREGAVKVTDFGIAKAVGKEQVTEVGVVKGKVHYMSPEQYTGADVDKRSDIFSLGVVLYQLTTGRLPRVSKNGQLNMRQVTEGRIPRPSEIRADYPEELDEIVMRALAQNPEDRYRDCAALRDDLLDFARTNDLLAFPNELGDYVNALVPPQPLHEPDPEFAGHGGRRSAPALPPLETEAPPPTEKVELSQISPRITSIERRSRQGKASTHALDPFERETDIPIEPDRPTVQGQDESRAVLTGERPTPMPFDESTAPPQGRDRVFRLERRRTPPSGRSEVVYGHGRAELAPPPVSPRGTVPAKARHGRPTGPAPRVFTEADSFPRGERDDAKLGRRVVVPGRASWIGALAVAISVAAVAVGVVLFLLGRRPLPAPTMIQSAAAGEIDVLSDPVKASVFVDGAQRCEDTPCRVAGLPLNRELVVTVRGDGRYDLWVQRVVLSSEQSRLLLKAALSQRSEEAPAKKRVASRGTGGGSKRAVAATPSPGRAAPASGGKRGKGDVSSSRVGGEAALLAVDVRPGWAEVWIDREKRGHTPMQIQVEPGAHTVELKNPERSFHVVYRVRAKTGVKIKITDKIEGQDGVAAGG